MPGSETADGLAGKVAFLSEHMTCSQTTGQGQAGTTHRGSPDEGDAARKGEESS